MDKIEEFVQETRGLWSDPKLYAEATRDLSKLSDNQWVKKYGNFIRNDQKLALGWEQSKIEKNTKPLPERLRRSFGDDKFEPSESRKNAVYRNEYSDIPREEFERQLSNMKTLYDDEVRARQYEADRMVRAKEVKNLPWYANLAASDYSKARYIDDPSTSILGGREFNPYASESQKEIRDVILGATAGALDFMPATGATYGGGIWAGPLVRAARDVIHQDEKYKPQGNIASSIFTDVAGNAATDILPTAILRKLEKGGRNAGKAGNWIGDAYYTKNLNNEIAINNEARQLGREAVERLEKTESTGAAFGGKQLENDLRRIPESEYKTLVEQEIKNGATPLAALRRVEFKYKTNESAPMRELNEKLAERGTLRKSETATDLQKRDILRPELTPGQEWLELGFRKLGPVGSGVVKAFEPGKSRDVDNLEALKEWYKANYIRDWENGYIPNYKPGSPLWEAFKEYDPEKAKEVEAQFTVNDVYKKWENLGGEL